MKRFLIVCVGLFIAAFLIKFLFLRDAVELTPDNPIVEATDAANARNSFASDSVESETPGPKTKSVASTSELAFVVSEEMFVNREDPEHKHVIRQWKGQFSPPLQRLDQGKKELAFTISLPSEEPFKLELNRFKEMGANKGLWVGKLSEIAGGEVILSFVNDAVSGSFRNPQTNEYFEIRNAGNGQQIFAKIDIEAQGTCALCAPDVANNSLNHK